MILIFKPFFAGRLPQAQLHSHLPLRGQASKTVKFGKWRTVWASTALHRSGSISLVLGLALGLLGTGGMAHKSSAQESNTNDLKQTRGETARVFHFYDNYDVGGPMIRTFPTADPDGCRNACVSTSKCQAFGFDKWKKICSLRGSAETLRFDPTFMMGLQTNELLPPALSTAIVLQHFEKKSLAGNSYRSISVASQDACELACKNDGDCVAYTRFARGECKLFGRVESDAADSNAESAIKRQQTLDEEAWNAITDSDDRKKFAEFIETYPTSAHVDEAKQRLAMLPTEIPIRTISFNLKMKHERVANGKKRPMPQDQLNGLRIKVDKDGLRAYSEPYWITCGKNYVAKRRYPKLSGFDVEFRCKYVQNADDSYQVYFTTTLFAKNVNRYHSNYRVETRLGFSLRTGQCMLGNATNIFSLTAIWLGNKPNCCPAFGDAHVIDHGTLVSGTCTVQ